MLAVMVGVTGVLLTPVSGVVWRALPELKFLQFPWRLVAVLAAVVCAGLALAVGRVKGVVAGVVGLGLVVGMSWPAAKGFRQECDDEDTVAARRAVFVEQDGSEATDEYTPQGADNDALKQGDPGYWVGMDADAAPPASATAGETPMRFVVRVGADAEFDAAKPDKTKEDRVLVLNLRAYPAWRVRVNGVEAKAAGERADGLIAVAAPVGEDSVEIAYGRTVDETVGEAVSGVSGVAMVGLLGLGWRARRVRAGARSGIGAQL